MEQSINYDALVKEQVESFWRIEHVKSFHHYDRTRLKEAFLLAYEAHKPQVRKSGEPYIIHPIAVARIIAEEFNLEPNTIIAAFLHDVVEDTPYTNDDIKARFGDDVAFLVGAVTKQKKEQYEMSKQIDNFKQMLDSIQYDIRALLIKLADRIHNMRTLNSMRPDKQMKIAGETDYFYAPLANRLGLYRVKTELESLSMQYRCPEEFSSLTKKMLEYMASSKPKLEKWAEEAKKAIAEYGITVDIEVKYRSVYSIWRKLQISGTDFKHIGNKHIIQVIFRDNGGRSEKNRSLQIYSALTDNFKEMPGSMRNYIDTPKENGYQAMHIKLLNSGGHWEEVHILSERMLSNSKMGCLAERKDGANFWIAKFKDVLKELASVGKDGGFIENVVSNFYNDDIIVFTPNGNGVVLPKNATAIDFAFEIHSDIGLHAQYARINGKLSTIKSTLKRGDCIEIGTSTDVTPQKDWLNYSSTYKARKFLLSYFKKLNIDRSQYENMILCPHCNPLPGDEVIGFNNNQGKVVVHKRNCIEAVKQASKEGDNIVNIEFKESELKYPTSIRVRAIDRYHLLIDLVSIITQNLKLGIINLTTTTVDEIVDCNIDFFIHSSKELSSAIEYINKIDGVEEVQRINKKHN